MSRFLVGGYSPDMGGTAEGIAVLESRPDGSLENLGYLVESASPSYLLIDGNRVFAACEGTARVEAFDTTTGQTLGGDDAGGAYPCHLSMIDGTLLASCYADGSIGVLDPDRVRLTATVVARGSGPRVEQDSAHAHSTLAYGDRVLSADLGSDRIRVHSLRSGILAPTGSVTLPAGTGPRDLARHPSGSLLVLAELSNELMIFSPDLELIAATPLPGAVDGDHAAGISLSSDGRFVFVAVRGSDVIATVATDGSTLTAVGAVDSGGTSPRHHLIEGGMLHVANQLSNTVASFAIDGGRLKLVAQPTLVASPTHLVRA